MALGRHLAQRLDRNHQPEDASDVRLDDLAGSPGAQREEPGVEESLSSCEEDVELLVGDGGVELAHHLAEAAAECGGRAGEGDDVACSLSVGEDAQAPRSRSRST